MSPSEAELVLPDPSPPRNELAELLGIGAHAKPDLERRGLSIGDKVRAKFYGEWHPATVRRILTDGMVEVLWDAEWSTSLVPNDSVASMSLPPSCPPPACPQRLLRDNNTETKVWTQPSLGISMLGSSVQISKERSSTGEPQSDSELRLQEGPVLDGDGSKKIFEGVIKTFETGANHGFIASQDVSAHFGRNVYVHRSVLDRGNARVGDRVQFGLHINAKGLPQASAPLVVLRHEAT